MQIDWEGLSSEEFEQIISVLLSRTFSTRRVDGAGGDEGIDCSFHDETGYHIFQIKSFVRGRLSEGGRKAQIERSLSRALQHGPDRWTLIVGIDFTAREGEWFEGLVANNDVECVWHGRTWLVEQLARFPDIVRYYTEDSRMHVLRSLSILKDEQTQLALLGGGVPDVLTRLGALAKQADELSPHYRFRWVIEGAQLSVELQPKYPGAERDEPLRVTVRATEADASERLATAMERLQSFGIPVELDGTQLAGHEIEVANFFGGTLVPTRLEIRPIVDVEPPTDSYVRVDLVAEADRPALSRSMKLVRVTRGQRGITITAQTEDRALKATFELDVAGNELTADFVPQHEGGVLPLALLGAYEWLDGLSESRTLQVVDSASDMPILAGRFSPADPVPPHEMDLLTTLADLQQHSGREFPVPGELTSDDVMWLGIAHRLINGEEVEIPWSSQVIPLVPREGVSTEQWSERHAMLYDETEMSVVIAENEIPLGPARSHFPDVVINNFEAVKTAVREGREIDLELTPGPNGRVCTVRLLGIATSDDDSPR